MTDHPDAAGEETLREFKDSFFYGSRSNLDFKFLADLPPEEAGDFLAGILRELSSTIDDGNAARLLDFARAWQRRTYAEGAAKLAFDYDDRPFTPLAKPLRDARVALVTSSGHFVAGDDPCPFGVAEMTQAEAEARIGEFLRAAPTWSTIPVDTAPEQLRVRHGGYPAHAATVDHNVVLPLDALRDLADEGVIGAFSPRAYSFVGATSQLRLRDHVAPAWAAHLRAEDVDAVLLVPV